MTTRESTMTSTVAAVIYAAKSSEDEHGSIPTQIADCKAMAEREGWVIAETYKDEKKAPITGLVAMVSSKPVSTPNGPQASTARRC